MINEKSTPSEAYLGTSVISGYVKNDMKSTDLNAFEKIVQMSKSGEIVFCASTVVREEIEKIPEPYREKHVEMYETLNIRKGSVTTWIDDEPLSTGYGQSVQDVDFVKLINILTHENDARHLFHAKKASITDIITADYKSILSKVKEIEYKCGLRVYSPSDYFESRIT